MVSKGLYRYFIYVMTPLGMAPKLFSRAHLHQRAQRIPRRIQFANGYRADVCAHRTARARRIRPKPQSSQLRHAFDGYRNAYTREENFGGATPVLERDGDVHD